MKVNPWRLGRDTPFGRKILAVICVMALKQGFLALDLFGNEVTWCRNSPVVLTAKIMPVTAVTEGVGRAAWQNQDQRASKAKKGSFHSMKRCAACAEALTEGQQ
jgi:hypothetical protein